MNEIKSQSPLLGAEFMHDVMPFLEIGGFYQQNFLSYKSGESGSIRFGGFLGRFHIFGGHAGLFADAQLGIASRMQGQNTSGGKLSYGGGMGYEIPLGYRLSLSPHVGVRMLPDSVSDSVNRPVVDGAIMLSIRL